MSIMEEIMPREKEGFLAGILGEFKKEVEINPNLRDLSILRGYGV